MSDYKPPAGLLDTNESRIIARTFTTLGPKIPVRISMLDDLETMLGAYEGLIRSTHGPDSMSASLLFRDKIRPRLEAIVRGNFDYCSGRHPRILAAMERLTSPIGGKDSA
jgi:hypothetical protein